MVWYIISAVFFVVVLALLVYTRIKDRRYERLRVLNAVSREMRGEIEDERAENLAKKEKFEEAMREAAEKTNPNIS